MRELYHKVIDWILGTYLDQYVGRALIRKSRIFGDESRLHVARSAVVQNALFNLSSGTITVGENTFFGHNVTILTGTHDFLKFGKERQTAVPKEGRDVVIGEGVWIASNVTILGPCTIGEHSVVAAGSLVKDDIPPYAIVAGVPSKIVRLIKHNANTQDPEKV